MIAADNPNLPIGTVEYVGFWQRFLAQVVDNILASIAITLAIMPFFDLSLDPAQTSFTPEQLRAHFLYATSSMLFVMVLVLVFWVAKSATPGKMMIRAKIVDAKTLAKPRVSQLLVRYLLGYTVSFAVLGLGFIWVGLDGKKQGWHDKIAGTLVISDPKK